MIRIPSDIEFHQYLNGDLSWPAFRRVAKAIAQSSAAQQSLGEVRKDIEICEQLAEMIRTELDDAEAQQLEQRLREAVSSSIR